MDRWRRQLDWLWVATFTGTKCPAWKQQTVFDLGVHKKCQYAEHGAGCRPHMGTGGGH